MAVALLVGAIVVVPLTVSPPEPRFTVSAKAEPAAGVTLNPELIVTAFDPKEYARPLVIVGLKVSVLNALDDVNDPVPPVRFSVAPSD